MGFRIYEATDDSSSEQRHDPRNTPGSISKPTQILNQVQDGLNPALPVEFSPIAKACPADLASRRPLTDSHPRSFLRDLLTPFIWQIPSPRGEG